MAEATPQGIPSAQSDHQHELRDVSLRGVLTAVACLVATVVVLYFALWGLLALFNVLPEKPDVSLSPLASQPQTPPPPRLQEQPQEELKNFRAAQQADLNGYGWSDKKAGRIHIPVERAKDLFLQENPAGAGSARLTGGRP